MQENFDIREFNRLPRPELISLENPSPEVLERMYPFLFKPNRALALHAKSRENDGHDPGQPLKQQGIRWLIKLIFPPQFNYPPCVAAIGRDGCISFWAYTSSEKEPSGLFPIQLSSRSLPENSVRGSGNHIYLSEETERNSEVTPGLLYRFNLLRVIQHCDRDGVMFLRLITLHAEHVIQLGLGTRYSEEPIPYHYSIQSPIETLEKVDPPNERMRFPADFCPRKNAASKAGFRLIQESLYLPVSLMMHRPGKLADGMEEMLSFGMNREERSPGRAYVAMKGLLFQRHIAGRRF